MKNLKSVINGGYMEYQGGTSYRLWSNTNATHATNRTPGGKDKQMWWNCFHNTSSFQDYTHQSKLPRTSKEVIHVIKNTEPQTPYHDQRDPITGQK